eukprot:TRINITY_DN9570_c0_g1_i2.p1 TRINITY_DN9570_c0_g1~~TRINITY_DN9570_c0_g1_i2.p1  ORF type:complete len:274 (+),score=77.65 TRINITY_DN9570_c0_g1_i2:473-1294(+)
MSESPRMPTCVAQKYLCQDPPARPKVEGGSYGSKETDLLVQKVKLDNEMKEARRRIIELTNLLADAQDDANELAAALDAVTSEKVEVEASVKCWEVIRKTYGHPESVAQQLATARRVLSEVTKMASIDVMAESAASCIKAAQDRLHSVLDASEVEDVTLAALVDSVAAKLLKTRTQLTEGDEMVQDSQQLMVMARAEVVRLQAKINEEKRAAEEAAGLRASLARQLDSAGQAVEEERHKTLYYKTGLAVILERQSNARILSRYYSLWEAAVAS